MSRPTIRQLEYLVALEDARSFSIAAENCNVTQSTLSAGIKELEITLDHVLVTRGRKNITLTAFGTEVAADARKILNETDKISARAQQIKAPLSGPLRLGVIPTIAPYYLPKILPLLNENFPAMELQLHEDLSERILQKLNAGLLDIAIMAFPFDTPGHTQTILFDEPFILACPKGHEPQGKTIKTSDLDPGELLLLEDGHCLRDHALSACGLQPPDRRKAYSATSLPTLIQMVNSGFGVTLLPQMASDKKYLPNNISLIEFSAPVPTRNIGTVWRSNHPRREEFETLLQTLKTVK